MIGVSDRNDTHPDTPNILIVEVLSDCEFPLSGDKYWAVVIDVSNGDWQGCACSLTSENTSDCTLKFMYTNSSVLFSAIPTKP